MTQITQIKKEQFIYYFFICVVCIIYG